MINYATWAFASTPRSTELVLSGPPCARKLAELSLCRLAPSHGNGFVGLHLSHLVPTRRKRQTHSPNGFSSRRLLRKSLTPFSGESPAAPRFPLGRSLRSAASPLCPKAVTVWCWLLRRAQTAPAPCSTNQVYVGGSLRRQALRNPNPDSGPATHSGKRRDLVGQGAAPDRRPAKGCPGPAVSVPPGKNSLSALPQRAAFGNCPLRVLAALPCGARNAWHADKKPHFGDTASRYAASHGLSFPTLGKISSNVWKTKRIFFQSLERAASLRGKNFQALERGHLFLPTSGPEPQAREAPPYSGGAVTAGSGKICPRTSVF